jgi:hypothetical protein
MRCLDKVVSASAAGTSAGSITGNRVNQVAGGNMIMSKAGRPKRSERDDVPVKKAPDQPPPPIVFKAQPPAKKAAGNIQGKASTNSEAQSQSVLNARKARRAASNRRQSVRDANQQVEHQRQMVEYEKAAKAQREYEIRMGPVWAAEHANAIQQQRNALIAQRNAIEKQKADYDAWILWQLRNQSR